MIHSYRIEETDDYLPLSRLFHEGGVEVHISEKEPIGTVKMWRLIDAESGALKGGVTLEIRDNVYAIGGIAVDPSWRGDDLGETLLEHLYAEARRMNVTELWVSAKIPDYYVKKGWEIMGWNDSPKVAINCSQCVRYRTECHPKILRYKL